VPAPTTPPLGLQLAGTAKAVRRAFEDALAAGGGSLPEWLILVSVKSQDPSNQRDLAAAVGITAATLTHHLNAMEADGLLVRRRDPTNRRIQHVELTTAGEATFNHLRDAATAFDRQLRSGLNKADTNALSTLLQRLHDNVRY
jgi:MarR family transcriptional regulator, transcriptional regulator for hemolysin